MRRRTTAKMAACVFRYAEACTPARCNVLLAGTVITPSVRRGAQMLWHRVRNQAGAPTNAQAKAWLAQAPDNPPVADPEPQPAGRMVMRNGKYVVVKPGEKKPKPKPALEPEPEPEQEPEREPEPQQEPEPVIEQPKEVDPEDDPNLSEQEKKAIRRAKQKVYLAS